MADKEGFGFLYPKKDRKGSQPHLTGHVIFNGKKVELAGWKKTSSNGVPYLSLKAQDGGDAELESIPEAATTAAEGEDPIPF